MGPSLTVMWAWVGEYLCLLTVLEGINVLIEDRLLEWIRIISNKCISNAVVNNAN